MPMTIGQMIKSERKNKKFTQSDLAGDFISVEDLRQIEEKEGSLFVSYQ